MVTERTLQLLALRVPVNCRSACRDRAAGLQYGKDGSLDIYVQTTPPASHESNWLPAPTGRFSLTMRLHLPQPRVLDGLYRYPTVEVAR